MASQAEALYELQTIDLETIKHRKRLKEIAVLLADNAAVQAAQAAVEERLAELKPLQTRSRDLELETQSNTTKAKASEDRLYSGKVKSPKEMQDLQNEIEALKARGESLDESLLENMMVVEAATEALEAAEAALAEAIEESRSEHGDLLDEKESLETRLTELATAREKAVTNVTPQNQSLYDKMRVQKANRPISILDNKSCTTCGVEQTVAIAQAARKRDELVKCENCGRILVAR